MATLAEMQQQLDAQQAQLAAMQETVQKAYSTAADALKTLINARTVGINDRLGALSAADSLATAPVGDQATVRNAIGAYGNGSYITAKSVTADGVEVGFVDLHTLGGDGKDFQVRIICDGDGHAKIIGTVDIQAFTMETNGSWSIGATILAACYTNANIGFDVNVAGTDLMPCSASGWTKDTFRLNGTWRSAGQCGGRYDLTNSGLSIGLWRRVS